MMQKFDVAVMGSGPGGYVAAIKVAQNGKSVALIEPNTLGGTCLNRGCIPSKVLIAGAEALHKIRQAQEFGISVGEVSFDYKKMVERKDATVGKIRQGLQGLIASNKITVLKGYGKLTSPNTIKVTGDDNLEIEADKIIIATGSEPREMAQFPFDYKKIHDSTSMLEIQTLPKKIVIVGGGVIGCEFASLFVELNVEVIILEALPTIIPMEGKSVSTALTRAFIRRGIKIETNVFVESIENTADGIRVRMAGGNTIEADMALVAVGRKLNTKGIGLEKAGVLVDEKTGIIPVNEKMETSVPGIYAIGDIASTIWLAHVASHQGLVAASNAIGIPAKMHYNAVPVVIFTIPEVATVGYSLEKAIEAGYKATLGMFPFQALGKSQAALQTEGFAQVVCDKSTGQILGAQVVGHEASTLIAEMALAITNELTLESVTQTIHAHPTLAEAWLEAAFVAADRPIHMPPKKIKEGAAV
jgi:dihydrolipoamide dehydrogenase